jgi:hypothetical protein
MASRIQVTDQDAMNAPVQGKPHFRRALLIFGGVILVGCLYAAAVLISIVANSAVPPEADALSFVGAEALAVERGFKFEPNTRFRTEGCLAARAVCKPDEHGRFSAEDVIKNAGYQLIPARTGPHACSSLLLEPLWRRPCIVISIPRQIRMGALTPGEIDKILAAIREPCRVDGITTKTTNPILGCDSGRLSRVMRAVVFVDGKKETLVIR